MNKLSKFFGAKVFAGKSRVHLFQPKYMNFYFKKSLNSKFTMVNFNTIDCVNFYVEEKKENESVCYVLNAMLNNDLSNVVELAEFKDEKDAEEALLETRIHTSTPIKTMGKWLVIATMLVLFTNTTFSFVSIFVPAFKGQQTKSSSVKLPSIEQAEREMGFAPGTVPRGDQAQVQELVNQLQKMQSGQVSPGQPSVESQPQEQQQQQQHETPLSATEKLLKGIQ